MLVFSVIDFGRMFGVDCLLRHRGGGAGVGSSVDFLGVLLLSCAVNCSALCEVDVIVSVFRSGLYGFALLLLLSACAVDWGDGV